MAALEAYEPIERRWQQRLTGLDIAVDEIPRIQPKDPEACSGLGSSGRWPDSSGAPDTGGCRRQGSRRGHELCCSAKPIERRAKDSVDLTDLLHEILVAQVATYLGVGPSVIDPSLDED